MLINDGVPDSKRFAPSAKPESKANGALLPNQPAVLAQIVRKVRVSYIKSRSGNAEHVFARPRRKDVDIHVFDMNRNVAGSLIGVDE